MNLIERIHAEIAHHGAITFADYTQLALYTPNLGYYSAGLPKLGSQGDFVTAPELSPLFGQTLAHQCQQVLQTLSAPKLLEFGAGTGRLCVDLLQQLEKLACLPEEYLILEVSNHLKQCQAELIQQRIPHLASKVRWLSAWPDVAFNGVVIANEVLDAMPVHRFMQTDADLLESYIELTPHNDLQEVFKPCKNTRLRSHVNAALSPDLIPYLSEANLFLNDWFVQCNAMLQSGLMLVIDYGFPRHEYYHPDRKQGTLMCHYRHRAHPNPLLHVGEQDITAHVDFTHVAEAAFTAGFQVAGYTNQASFLLANGLLTLLADIIDEHERVQQQQVVKQLLQPHEMGELFKVMALTKNLDLTLTGFLLNDKRVSL